MKIVLIPIGYIIHIYVRDIHSLEWMSVSFCNLFMYSINYLGREYTQTQSVSKTNEYCHNIHYSSLYLIENREIIRVMLPLLTISGRIKILSSRYWNFILFLVMSGCITYFILPLLKFYPSAVEFYAPLTTPVLSKSRNNEVRQPPGFGHNKIISRSID